MKLTDLRTDSSSSTRWTVRLPSAILVSRGVVQREVKGGAAEARLFRPDPAAMAGDDRMADRKADAHAVGLGAEEGLEQPIGHFGREPRPAILDLDPDLAAVGRAG